MNIELLCDYACVTGENPLWHPAEKCIYWNDIPNGKVFKYDPTTGAHGVVYHGEVTGGFTFQADGGLLLFQKSGAIRQLKDGVLTTLLDHIAGEEESRFNDVMADPEGRVFCGTMPSPDPGGKTPGALYLLETNGTLSKLFGDVTVSNGMGFTPDLTQFYHTDSLKRTIDRFDYDRASGNISNRNPFVHSQGEIGVPDGMTVDTDGCVWSARWDGNCITRYSPAGKELMRIYLPVKKVSSACFGGDDFGDLYLTTAGGHIKHTDGEHAGALYRVNLRNYGIRGTAEYYSRVKVGE
jgi:D-xylonolactonase